MSQSYRQPSPWVNPYWILFVSGLFLVLLAAAAHQNSRSEVCFRASHELCPDLLKAKIQINRHASRSMVASLCGDQRSNACAIRRARWQQVTCDVHVLSPEDPSVLQHELNHCRGWEHQGDTQEAYEQPWVPNWRLMQARGNH